MDYIVLYLIGFALECPREGRNTLAANLYPPEALEALQCQM
jgi:hypothetical protein